MNDVTRLYSLPLAGRVREGGVPQACCQKIKQRTQPFSPLPNPPREGDGLDQFVCLNSLGKLPDVVLSV